MNGQYLKNINSALEEKGWFHQDYFLSPELCKSIIACAKDLKFEEAKVSSGIKKNENQSIRKNSIKWITSWEENSSLKQVNTLFSEIMISLNEYFRLSIKRYESQLAIYQNGGFYKLHLDQHPGSRHRQISCCLYLNDCDEGGELVLYKKGSKEEVDKIVTPRQGTLVLFISKDIFHEVKLVKATRYSISTWFRDDAIIPFI